MDEKGVVLIDDLSLGLATTERADQIPPGAARIANNVRTYPKGIRQARGTKRIMNHRVQAPAVLLDGRRTYFFGRLQSAGSSLALTGTAFTIEVFIRPDTLKTNGTILMKGIGGTSPYVTDPGVDWFCELIWNGTAWAVVAGFWDGTGASAATAVTKSTDSGGLAIMPTVEYHVVFGRDAGNFYMYLHRPGTSIGSAATTALPGGWAGQQDLATSDFFVGAFPNTTGYRLVDRAERHFPGVIQEVRVWTSVVRTTQQLIDNDDLQLAAGPDLLYPLTGWNGAEWAPSLGSGPTLVLEPVDAIRDDISFEDVLRFDGHYSGFLIRDSYRLREPSTSTVGSEGELDMYASWCVFGEYTPARLVKQCLAHSVHFTDDEEYRLNYPPEPSGTPQYNGTITASLGAGLSQEVGNWIVQVATHDGADHRLRFVLWLYNFTDSVYEAYAVSSATLVAGTTYRFAFFVAPTTISCFINGAQVNAELTTTVGKVKYVPRTSDDPIGSRVKYALSVGRGFKDSRRGQDFPGDPNDVDVRYRTDRHLDGKLRQFGFAVNITNVAHQALYFANNDLTRETANVLDGQVLLFLPMDEGRGETLRDYGLAGIGANIAVDSGYRGDESLITTTLKSPTKGIFGHEYRDETSATGTTRRGIAIGGGALYDFVGGFGTTASSLTRLSGGIRNDAENKVCFAQWRDSLIACTGFGRNYHIVRTQVYSLHLDPPAGYVAAGLTDQGGKRASLERGRYRYAFAFYSRHTGKWSPVGIILEIEILQGKANVVMGTGEEVAQTYPRTSDSINKADYDFSDPSCIIRGNAWYGTTGSKAATDPGYWESGIGSGGTNAAKYKRIVFTDDDGEANPLIKNKKDVSEDEVQAVVEDKAPKIRVRAHPDGRVEFYGVYPGTHGFMQLANQSGGKNMIGQSAGVIGFTGATAGSPIEKQWQGDGETDGPPLPVSTDPQCTELGIFRTIADGTDLRLLALIPNGQTSFTDTTPNEELTGQLLKITSGFPPPCTHVIVKDGTAFYFGNKEYPFRLWWSRPNEPWNVPPQQFVDVSDGKPLPIVMAGAIDDVLAVMKGDATIVVEQGGGTGVAGLKVRDPDTGAVSRFGAVEANAALYYPTPKGFHRFDGTLPQYISKHIEPTWKAIFEHRPSQIVAGHDPDEEQLYFFGALPGSSENNGAACLNYGGTTRNAFTTMSGIYAAYAASIVGQDGIRRLFLIDHLGFISVLGEFGAYGPDTSIVTSKTIQTGTTGTIRVTSLGSAAYPEGYLGMPVTVVDASDATGATRETRYVAADDLGSPNSVLTLDTSLSFTPAAGDTAIFGSIEAEWESGEVQFLDGMVSHVEAVFLGMENPGTAADVRVALRGVDGQNSNDAEVVKQWANTKTAWWEQMQSRGHGHIVNLSSKGVSKPFEVTTLGFRIREADRGRGAGGGP